MPAQLAVDAPAPESTELHLRAHTSLLHEAREFTRKAAAALGLGARAVEELVYAVNEAVTNAIRHGAPNAEGSIHLAVTRDREMVEVAVRDWGRFIHPEPARQAAEAEHGRGFALMATFVDDVRLSIGSGTTTVTLCKTLT